MEPSLFSLPRGGCFVLILFFWYFALCRFSFRLKLGAVPSKTHSFPVQPFVVVFGFARGISFKLFYGVLFRTFSPFWLLYFRTIEPVPSVYFFRTLRC